MAFDSFESTDYIYIFFSQLPEQLKAYYKQWLDIRNEQNSIEQHKVAFDRVKKLLIPSNSAMPAIPVFSQMTLDHELHPNAPAGPSPGPSKSNDLEVSDWHVGILLGKISMQQTSIQFQYGQNPASSGSAPRKRKLDNMITFVEPTVPPVPGSAGSSTGNTGSTPTTSRPAAPAVKKRRKRHCKKCGRADCQGVYLSRVCAPVCRIYH